jgi:hypothetical protein
MHLHSTHHLCIHQPDKHRLAWSLLVDVRLSCLRGCVLVLLLPSANVSEKACRRSTISMEAYLRAGLRRVTPLHCGMYPIFGWPQLRRPQLSLEVGTGYCTYCCWILAPSPSICLGLQCQSEISFASTKIIQAMARVSTVSLSNDLS